MNQAATINGKNWIPDQVGNDDKRDCRASLAMTGSALAMTVSVDAMKERKSAHKWACYKE
jgi:hypothetical protein